MFSRHFTVGERTTNERTTELFGKARSKGGELGKAISPSAEEKQTKVNIYNTKYRKDKESTIHPIKRITLDIFMRPGFNASLTRFYANRACMVCATQLILSGIIVYCGQIRFFGPT